MASKTPKSGVPQDFEIQEYEPLRQAFKRITPSRSEDDGASQSADSASSERPKSPPPPPLSQQFHEEVWKPAASGGGARHQRKPSGSTSIPSVSKVVQQQPSPDHSSEDIGRYKRIELQGSTNFEFAAPPTPVTMLQDEKIPPDFFNKTMGDFARLFYIDKEAPVDNKNQGKRIAELYKRMRYCMGSVDATANDLLIVKSTLDGIVPTVYQLAHQVSVLSQEVKNPELLNITDSRYQQDARFQQQRLMIENFVNQNFQRFSTHINQMSSQITILKDKEYKREEIYEKYEKLEEMLDQLMDDNNSMRSILDEIKNKKKRQFDDVLNKLKDYKRENDFLKNEYKQLVNRISKLEQPGKSQNELVVVPKANYTTPQTETKPKPVPEANKLYFIEETGRKRTLQRSISDTEQQPTVKKGRKRSEGDLSNTSSFSFKQKSPKSLTINKSDILRYQANPKLLNRALRSSKLNSNISYRE